MAVVLAAVLGGQSEAPTEGDSHLPVLSEMRLQRTLERDALFLRKEALDAANSMPTPSATATPTLVATVTPTPAGTTVATPIPTPVPERVPPPVQGSVLGAVQVYVTFYTCPPYCGDPSGPLPLAEGQAACDWAYMGRRFILNGAEWICNDTGGLVYGAHVDLFFWSEADGWAYLAQHGTEGELEWLN